MVLMAIYPDVHISKRKAHQLAKDWTAPIWYCKYITGVTEGQVHRRCIPVMDKDTGQVLVTVKCYYCDYRMYVELDTPRLHRASYTWTRERQKAVDQAGYDGLFWHFYGVRSERCAAVVNSNRTGHSYDRPAGFTQRLGSEYESYVTQLWPNVIKEVPWVKEPDGTVHLKFRSAQSVRLKS